MITEILTIADVELFMTELVNEGTNAHPDDDFFNYVNIEDGLPSYTPDESSYEEPSDGTMFLCVRECRTGYL